MDPDTFRSSDSGTLVLVNGEYSAFVPNPLPPGLDWTLELISALSQADRALGQLAGVGRTLPNPHLLIRPFLRREAVLSSRIEGTRASLSDVLAYEANQSSFLRSTRRYSGSLQLRAGSRIRSRQAERDSLEPTPHSRNALKTDGWCARARPNAR